MLTLVPAETPERIRDVAALFSEYAAIPGIEICVRSLDREVEDLPGEYAPPSGRLIVALQDGKAVGCVAVARLSRDLCEMRRLYVRPEARGLQAGRRLAAAAMKEAAALGYARMRLETLPARMKEAIALYRSLGFHDTALEASCAREGVLVMERDLT